MAETVVIQSTPPSAPEGHDEKMVALAEGAANPQQDLLEGGDPASRPEWLPQEFQSAEDLAKAYSELQAKLGAKSQESAEASKTETPTEQQNPEQALSEKGLDFSEFSAEFATKGELSPESYAKLEAAGFDKQIVDNYIAGQKAVAAQYETEILAEVGGREKYSEITAWAKANLTPSEIDAFNAAVSSGNTAQAKLAVLGLSAQFSKAVGSEPKLVQGRPTSASEDVFESTAQLTEAMRNPLYRSDPAYRAKVQAKLARSNIL